MKDRDLDQLLNDIARINPFYANMLGSNVPGMMRTSVTSLGASNAAAEVIANLKHDTSLFAALVTTPRPDKAQIAATMQAIEGSLMTLSVFGRITDDYRDTIINRMQDIAKSIEK